MVFVKKTALSLLLMSLASCQLLKKKSEREEARCAQFHSEEELISCLREDAPESVLKDGRIAEYLKSHKVYVSLTTSPQRIQRIVTVLKTIDLDLVSEIFLTLPHKFKNKESYPDPLPSEIVNFPKLKILRPEKDIGPITKIIPAIEHVKMMDPQSIVISLDDDTVYPIGIFGALVKYMVLNDVKVVGAWGQPAWYWGLHSSKVHFANACKEEGSCDVVEGFATIAYRAGAIPTDLMRQLVEADIRCKLGDDIVINYALEFSGIPRYKINSYYRRNLIQLNYGHGADALHQQNNYSHSYQKCMDAMDALKMHL